MGYKGRIASELEGRLSELHCSTRTRILADRSNRLFCLRLPQAVEKRRLVGRLWVGELILAGRSFGRGAQVAPLANRQCSVGRAQHREADPGRVGEREVQAIAAIDNAANPWR